MMIQMTNIGTEFNLLSKSASFFLGGLVVILFGAMLATQLNLYDIVSWGSNVLGASFIALMAGLCFLTVFSMIKAHQLARQGIYGHSWLEAGYQAANGITTLALTYTLLGISLGIGTLAEQTLSPDTIQGVTQALTAKFALAFMTTVIGLPLSSVLRAMLAIYQARLESQRQMKEQS
ncbi:MAG: hypothetical protein AB8B77_06465 [Alphaproteobacteria bacterium]